MRISILLLFIVQLYWAENGYWVKMQETQLKLNCKRQIIPEKYELYQLSVNEFKNFLPSIPHEKAVPIQNGAIITIPDPDGNMQQFKIVEAPIMEPALAGAFPNIKTYSIKGITDPYASGKVDFNDFGFHGMIRSINGNFFIDPYGVETDEYYISYYTKDFKKPSDQILPEAGLIDDHNKDDQSSSYLRSLLTPAACGGTNLRTYRLAIACTGEYAVAATGQATPSISQTLSKITTSINRVDGVYETEVAVRLILVATETNVIYTDANTDPFTGNNNAIVLIAESQNEISTSIGSANYDIGHTFSTGGGGLANLGVVCNSTTKASGITGSPSPVGDPFDIDYVCHEMGHQFGGNHTFNATTSSCGGGNRNAATAVEPGSGVTIMAYAGICGSNDLQSNSIAYFHGISYDEIVNFTTNGGGNGCALTSTTINHPPVVASGGSFIVPANTPFALSGSATDPDGDPLTFSWEEIDIGTSGNWNSGSKPFFRSYVPTSSPVRNFPIYSSVLNNTYQGIKGEYLPTTTQDLTFRLTARDNQMGGGGVCYNTASVTVDATTGPLEITYPNSTGIAWQMADSQTITWNVNNTNAAPVNCSSVNILISYDSGVNFVTLASNVPNTGAAPITVPTLSANVNTCRIKIEAAGNIFYDINSPNFSIDTLVSGINEIPLSNAHIIRVYPNPTKGIFKIYSKNLDDREETKVEIMDLMGRSILNYNYNKVAELNEEIDPKNISRGVYMIILSNGEKRSLSRLIIE